MWCFDLRLDFWLFMYESEFEIEIEIEFETTPLQ